MLADTGVRDVIEGEAEARMIVEPPGEFAAGLELDGRTQLLAVAAVEPTHRAIGRDDDMLPEIEIDPDAAVAHHRALAGEEHAHHGLDEEKAVGEAEFEPPLGRLEI